MATKINGIDVSYHNGIIDWKKVASSGIKFAVIREGYRKTIDTQFLNNVKGAVDNNITVMVYHFIYTDNATIKENAESTVANMKKASLDLSTTWVWVDLEYDTWKKNGEKCTRDLCSKYTEDYIAELKKLGCKKIGIYMNNDYYKNYYSSTLISQYPIWLADYSGDADYNCVIQQYSSSGVVSGINSQSVDMNYLFDESYMNKKSSLNGGNKNMTEKELRQSVVNWMVQYVGIAEGSTKHKEIINTFNNSGLCTRYKMTVNDAWCATTVSAAFIANGLAGKAGSGSVFECVECGCGAMINLAKAQGTWVENDKYVPTIGDVVLYDWDDGANYATTDNVGYPEHVGNVVSCNGSTIKVIEGNKNNTVGYRDLAVNGRYIRGFIVPKYSLKATATPQPVPTPTPAPQPTVNLTVTKPASGTTFSKTCKFVGVTTTTLNVRKGAGTDWEKCSFSPLDKGVEVEVCDTCSNGWYYIKYDGKYGFCSNEYVTKKVADPTATPIKTSLNRSKKWTGVVTASSLNVRTWAGTANPTCSFSPLKKGTEVWVCDTVKAKDGSTWYYICYKNKYGFVHSSYVKKSV